MRRLMGKIFPFRHLIPYGGTEKSKRNEGGNLRGNLFQRFDGRLDNPYGNGRLVVILLHFFGVLFQTNRSVHVQKN